MNVNARSTHSVSDESNSPAFPRPVIGHPRDHYAATPAILPNSTNRLKRPSEEQLPRRQSNASQYRRISIESLLNPPSSSEPVSAPDTSTPALPNTSRPQIRSVTNAQQVSLNRHFQHLGMLAQNCGNHRFATTMFERSLTGVMTLPISGTVEVEAGSLMFNIAEGWTKDGRHVEAHQLFINAQTLFRKNFPEDSAIVAGLDQIVAEHALSNLQSNGTQN